MSAPESKAVPSRPCINCGQPLPHVGTGWKESGACRRNEGNATLADKPAPGMVDVLAAHSSPGFGSRPGMVGSQTDPDDEGLRCRPECGWSQPGDARGRPWDAYYAHVAAALSTAGFGDTAAARAEALRETCREWPDDAFDRCNQPAEFILWGKLFPPEALGPRCYEHAVKHTGHSMPSQVDQWAVFDLRTRAARPNTGGAE